MKKKSIDLLKLSVIESYDCEPTISDRDHRYIIRLDEKTTAQVIRCNDKHHRRVGDVVVEALMVGEKKIWAKDIDSDSAYSRDSLEEILTTFLENQ